MTVEAIKQAICELAEEERLTLAAWLNQLDYDAWDQEMVRDFSPGGRGMAWAARIKASIGEGKSTPMEDGFAELPVSKKALNKIP